MKQQRYSRARERNHLILEPREEKNLDVSKNAQPNEHSAFKVRTKPDWGKNTKKITH